jgi:putative peptidoglycan lipid II flippase
MLITILSKTIGFGRELILSYFYGASNVSDAYLISITIPSVIFGFVLTGLGAGYIPMYSKLLKNEGELKANLFTSNLVNILVLICSIIVVIGIVFTDPIVKIFASGFEGETLSLATQFTKVSIWAIYFSGIVTIFSGYLQIKGNYVIPALVGLPFNFFILISIIISQYTGNLIMAFGYVVAMGSQLILMIPYMRKNKYHYSPVFKLRDEHIINMAYIVMPLIIGVSVNQINALVDRTIASKIAIGGISALNYASKLNGFVQGIFVLSIATVLYPTISNLAAEKKIVLLKKSLSESITGINLLLVPATTGSMVFAAPIVSALFARGAFDNNALSMTASSLFFYSFGMIGIGLREILSRVFYALQDTKTPMINAAVGMVINIVLNIILSRYLGIGGLALATSIAAIFTTALLFISLHKKIGPFGMKQISISFLKILFASLIMGRLAKLSFNYLTTSLSENLSLLLAIGVGAVSYFVIIYFMKIEDVDVIVGVIKKKLGRRVF